MKKIGIALMVLMALLCFSFAACSPSEKTYTVNFVINDSAYGTVSRTSITNVKRGAEIIVNENVIAIGSEEITATPTESNEQYTYTFDKFEYTGTSVSGNMTITANFTRTLNKYTITFEMGEGSAIEPMSVDYGTTLASVLSGITINPPEHYSLEKWQIKMTDDSYSDIASNTILTEDVIVRAVYSIETYTVSVESNNIEYGNVDVLSIVDVPYGASIITSNNTLTINGETITATPTESNEQYTYTFDGFEYTGTSVSGNMAITANFTRTLNKYTITFEMDGGSLFEETSEITSLSLDYGTSISSLDTLIKSKTGYKFNGWLYSVDDGGNYQMLIGTETVHCNLKLKATWTIDYTMSLNVTSVTLYKDTTEGTGSFNLNSTHQIIPTLSVTPAETLTYEYVSNNLEVVTVTDDGLVTAVGEGSTTIIVTVIDNSTGESQEKSVSVNVRSYCEISDNVGFGTITGSNYYKLTTDIDLGEITTQNGYITSFGGTLDGQGHKLTYSYADSHYIRLFETIANGATIKNVWFNLTGTGSGNKAGQYGIAMTNNGTIENCFVDVTFLNVGQGGGTNLKSAMVQNNAGTIGNNVIRVNYTGTTSIVHGDNTIVGITAFGSGTVTNNMLIALVTNSTGAIETFYSDIESTNMATFTNLNDAVDGFDDFVSNGFDKGTLWTTDADGNIYFNGTKIIYRYLISDKAGFDAIANDSNGYYVMTADIDLGTISTQNGYITSFGGTLDGQGHKLTYSYADSHYIRLFETIAKGATIKNVWFNLTGTGSSNRAGQYGIAMTNNGTIENCFVDVAFLNVGQGGGTNLKSAMVQTNASTIRNNIVRVNYTGTTDIEKGTNTIIGITSGGNGTVTNNMLIGLVTNATGTIEPFYFDLTATNTVTFTTVKDAVDGFDDFVSNGFDKGTLWSTNADGDICFNGVEIIIKPLTLNSTSATLFLSKSLTVTNTIQLTASRLDVTYTSSNPDVATVEGGLVTAISQGEVTITATTGTRTATCSIKVYNYYEISTAEQFANISSDNAGYYVMTADIDLGTISTQNGYITSFGGTLDGQGHKLTYSYADSHYIRLFETIAKGATIKNVWFNLTGTGSSNRAGQYGIAMTNNGTIENCFVDVTFLNVGQGGGTTLKSAMVQNNNPTGKIVNNVIRVNYTGTTGIVKGTNTIVAITSGSQTGSVIKDNMVIALTPNATGDIEVIYFDYAITNTNKYTSEKDAIDGFDDFVSNGFDKGTLWSTDANGVYFNGTKVIG